MSTPQDDEPVVAPTPEAPGEGAPLTVAGRLSGYLSGGGIITPLLTALLAFAVGGLVVALTGKDPFETYRAIFDGTGLNWFFPWISEEDRTVAALNLQQTLIVTTPAGLEGVGAVGVAPLPLE